MPEVSIEGFRDLVEAYLPTTKKGVYRVRVSGGKLYVYHEDPDGVVGIEHKINRRMLKEPELEAQKIADTIDAAMLKYYRDAKSHRDYIFTGSDYYKGVTSIT